MSPTVRELASRISQTVTMAATGQIPNNFSALTQQRIRTVGRCEQRDIPMSAALDFGMLPPEINSARMYAGAGSGPLLVAASAWKSLAADLRSTASSCQAVLAALTEQEWHGPASVAMAAAATPYTAWMTTTAVHAEQTASQAQAAAAAYETAFVVTVPPPQIAANRAQLAGLVATNLVGQNTQEIAAIEVEYSEMWAQDAAAMYGYAAASAAATDLTSFEPPPQTTDTAGLSAQAAAGGRSALSKLMSSVPGSLRDLSTPAATKGSQLSGWNPFAPGSARDATGLNGVLNAFFGTDAAFGNFLNANLWNTIFGSGFYLPGNFLGTASDFIGLGQAGSGAADGGAGAAAVAAGVGEGAAVAGGAGNGISAATGNGVLVGPMSVPPSWIGTPQAPLSSALGATPMIAPSSAVAAGMPGVPMASMNGQGYARQVPQYGFKPTFVARPPNAG
jgi:PPE-repeat protein